MWHGQRVKIKADDDLAWEYVDGWVGHIVGEMSGVYVMRVDNVASGIKDKVERQMLVPQYLLVPAK